MLYSINLQEIIILTSFTLIITLIAFSLIKSKIGKITVVLLNLTTYFYSGIGITYNEIESEYLYKILIYLFIQTLTLIVFSLRLKNKPYKLENSSTVLSINRKYKFTLLFKIGIFLFFSTYIVRLVYPEFRLFDIFNFNLNAIDIARRRAEARNDSLLEIFRLVNIMMFPVFMIFLNRLIVMKETNKAIFFILLWVFGEFTYHNYIGRHELIVYGILLIIVILNYNKDKFNFNIKQFLLIIGIFVAITPLLLSFETYRTNQTLNILNFSESAKILLFKESDYPKHYNLTLALHSKNVTSNFFRWLITLPIPSIIAGPLKSNLTTINVFFSESILNVKYGSEGYFGYLPSVLGEGFLIYGSKFYWLHAIFIGLIISLINKYLSMNKEHRLLHIFFTIQLLTIGRGGIGGYLSFFVNSMFVYSIIYLINKKYKITLS